jgi:hypothetical protein
MRRSVVHAALMIRGFLPSLVLIAACGTVTAQDPDAAPVPDGSSAPDAGGPLPGQAVLQAETPSQDFGTVVVGRQSAQAVLAVRNAGAERSGALAVELVGGGSAHFTLTDGCTNATLEPAASCELRAYYAPTAAGAQTAALRVRATPGGEVAIVLLGNGLPPGTLTVDVEGLAFGSLDLGTEGPAQTLTVRNTGGEASATLAVAIADQASFEATDDRCSGSTLAPGGACTVAVAFRPDTVGSKATSLTINGGPAGAVAVSLGGTGTARLTVEVAGRTAGRVRSTPAGIDCGDQCSASFSTPSVMLEMTPGTGATFGGWSEACRGPDALCTVALDSAKRVGATFTYGLRVTVSNVVTGRGGRVTASAVGIDCGTACDAQVTAGQTVELQARPDSGQVFVEWRGACTGTGPCRVPVTSSVAVEAVFAPAVLDLTVTTTPEGCGVLTSQPAGIDCGSTCIGRFAYGTRITLTAATDPNCFNQEFDGVCLTSRETCTFTITRPLTINAQWRFRD